VVGPLSSAVWAAASQCGPKPPTADDAAGDCQGRSSRWSVDRNAAATSQGCFIAKFGALKEGELLDVARQVVFLQGSSPEDDPLIRISDAITGWRTAFPNLMVITVQGRNARWHLPLVEYPRETSEL